MAGDAADASLPSKARRLLELHAPGQLLVLPNAWDVASALVFAAHPSCRALATSSAAIAAALGHPDGESLAREDMCEAVGRIAAAVDVPVTADVESGYGSSPTAVEQTITALVDVGAVGANVEDWDHGRNRLFDVDEAVERVRAAREAADRRGVPLVLNARTDVFWQAVGDPAERTALAAERLGRYYAAGADCTFVPGVRRADDIAALLDDSEMPLNVLAMADGPSLAELRALGVRRVSVGSGPMRATLVHLRRLTAEYLGDGSFASITGAELPYAELRALLDGGA